MNNCDANMEKVCRCCMKANFEMKSVFDKDDSTGETIQLSDMIMAFADVQIKKGDGLPPYLCLECKVKLQAAFIFKKQCETSDATFRGMLPEMKVVIKEESVDNIEIVVQPDINNDSNAYDDIHSALTCENEKKDKGINNFTCNYCCKILHTEKGLKIHMRRHTCKICSASFAKTDHLVRHMKVHGIQKNQKYVCDECGAEFTKSQQLSKHKKNHMTTKNGEECDDEDEQNMSTNSCPDLAIQCEFCNKKFKLRRNYTQHVQLKHGMSDNNNILLTSIISRNVQAQVSPEKEEEAEKGSPSKILNKNSTEISSNDEPLDLVLASSDILTQKCDSCDKEFTNEEQLAKHKEENHLWNLYICTVCNKNFARGDQLIRHVRMHKIGIDMNILRCSLCEEVFDNTDHFVRHTKVHMQQDRPHACSECGRTFNRPDTLRTHMRTHSGVKDNAKIHLCIYCGKGFSNSSNMIVHMRRHTGELPYKCSHCEKGFPRSHDLISHERTHTGEKPFLCTLCGKSFKISSKLVRHSRVHTGERPHVCNLCGRGFTQSNDLTNHMRIHTGARPYVCGVCPARFTVSSQLKNHRQTTGHWMVTQPELKGRHRVEPFTPVTKPMPIKFKTFRKNNGAEKLAEKNPDLVEPLLVATSVENNTITIFKADADTHCITE